ncbi:MAG: alpha/beta hydrolase [Gemmatimonadota bacterium]|nr:alpha/beta hydrolase [Gemmatimonadota bacterium]MDH5196154.1 alpha/beta hydrolase [Gemmatimonadota bacterium]
MTAAATEQTVLVDGVSLFMRRVGDGPVTVVLHGGPGAHHDYLLPQYDRLAADRELLYYDQRGGGRSPVARDVPVDWRAHVEDLRSLLVQLDRTPATLLGYSWGGLLALLYTVEHPGTVGRLALVCPAPATARDRGRFEATFAERSRAPAILRERESLHASDLRTRDPEAYRRRLFELSVAGYFHDPARVRDLTPFRLTGRTQQAVWDSLGDYDLRTALASVRVPAIVLAGRHDPIPLDATADTAARLAAECIVFESSGHCPHVEESDRFTEVLDAWLPSRA